MPVHPPNLLYQVVVVVVDDKTLKLKNASRSKIGEIWY